MMDWGFFWKLLAQLVILIAVLAFMISAGVALVTAAMKDAREKRALSDGLKRTRRER